MRVFFRKPLNIFIFSFFCCTSLYLSYGLRLECFLKYNYFLQYVLLFIFIVGFILSVFFNKSKVFLMLFLLLLLYFFTGYVSINFVNMSFSIFFPFNIIVFVISINIIILVFYRERGILTSWGLKRTLFVLLQIYMFHIIISNNIFYKEILYYFKTDFVKLDFLANYFKIPSQFFLLWLLSFVIVLMVLDRAEDYAFLFILIHLFVILFFIPDFEQVFILKFIFLSVLALDIAIIKDFYSMAYLDELTGLPARRALREELLKLGNDYSVAMLDIDFFKKFNDRYGHDIGDQVLKMVASVMKKTKGGARVFRYGGEEFTILFPGKGVEEVSDYLDELRVNIAERPFTIRGKNRPKKKSKKKSISGTERVKITVSIGAAEKKNNHENADDVIKEADIKLYKAKKKGRNCVIY